MDEFTQRFIEASIADIKKEPARKRDLSAKHVIAHAWMLYWQWRDIQIELWAESTLESVPHDHLRAIEYNVSMLLFERRIFHERPDDHDVPFATAWGIACLRWWFREARELVPALKFTTEEIEAVIKPHLPPIQLTLFDLQEAS